MEDKFAKRIYEGRLSVLLFEEHGYIEKISELIKTVGKESCRICYICLNKPYDFTVQLLNENKVPLENFLFIDTMSSHYSTPEPKENCVFLLNKYDLEGINSAIIDAVSNKECTIVVFDDITQLLNYHDNFSIIRFTNKMVSDIKQKEVRKLFIVLTDAIDGDMVKKLVEDLSMFADNKLCWKDNSVTPC